MSSFGERSQNRALDTLLRPDHCQFRKYVMCRLHGNKQHSTGTQINALRSIDADYDTNLTTSKVHINDR